MHFLWPRYTYCCHPCSCGGFSRSVHWCINPSFSLSLFLARSTYWSFSLSQSLLHPVCPSLHLSCSVSKQLRSSTAFSSIISTVKMQMLFWKLGSDITMSYKTACFGQICISWILHGIRNPIMHCNELSERLCSKWNVRYITYCMMHSWFLTSFHIYSSFCTRWLMEAKKVLIHTINIINHPIRKKV